MRKIPSKCKLAEPTPDHFQHPELARWRKHTPQHDEKTGLFNRIFAAEIIYNFQEKSADNGEGLGPTTLLSGLRGAADPLHMFLQNGGGLFGLALAKGGEDGPMVVIRPFFPAGTPGGKEKTGAGRMQIIDGGKQARHGAWGKDQPMEAAVGLLPGMDVGRGIALARRRLGGIENGGGHVPDGVFQRQHFEGGAHFGDFAHFGEIEGGNAHAPARLADRQPLRLQPAEGFPHRHVAGLEFLGDMVLPQARARWQFAAHDALGEHPADAACDCIFRFPSHARSVAGRYRLVEAGVTVSRAADPIAGAEPPACRIPAMPEIRLSFGRPSCKAAAFPDKTQTSSKA